MQRIVDNGLKLDLHIHSSESSKKDGKKVKNNTLENLPVLIQKLDEQGVNVCAITDHDTFSYAMYTALKRTEEEENSIKKVLPGVEFSVCFFAESHESVVHVFSYQLQGSMICFNISSSAGRKAWCGRALGGIHRMS